MSAPVTIDSREQAYLYADANGFKYKRSRIGVAVYQNSDGRFMEISHEWAARYRAPEYERQNKRSLLIQTHTWEKT